MKNYFITILILATLFSCNDDFLDRSPLSELSPENSFNTADDLRLYTNSFYNDLPGFSGIIERDNLSDNVLYNGVPNEQQSSLRIIPAEAGSSGWNWNNLRKINIFFAYYQRCPDEAAKKEFSGVAHFFRAYFYFDKLKRFGGVPWYDQVIGSTDTELLMKPRDSREFIVQKIIEDLDKAIENLGTQQSSSRVNRWTALALKSRVCLFEGTFRKYHTNLNLAGAEELLNLAANAAQTVISQSPYTVYSTGNPAIDYRNLFASNNAIPQEIMLSRGYSLNLNVVNSINYYFLSPTQSNVSLTKSILNEYLLQNGTRYTDQANFDTKQFFAETQNRDRRLQQTIRTPGYTRIGNTQVLLPNFSAAMSGYQIVKFVSDETQDGFQASHQDIPIFRYGEVLLNFAEAKAELGSLTQIDLNNSINVLRNRAGMPQLVLSDANANPDASLQQKYVNVTGPNLGVILEVRRERRIELAMEGFRYDDLMRWKCGKLLEEHFKGMYFPSFGAFDLDNNGSLDVEVFTGTSSTSAPQKVRIEGVLSFSNGNSGNIVPFLDRVKFFNESRDYLYPIPLGDIQLNPNLTQNPNW